MYLVSNPRTAATQTLDSGLYLELFTLVPWMAVVPPLSPPPEIPPSELHVCSHFARACISLSSSCLLSIRFFV